MESTARAAMLLAKLEGGDRRSLGHSADVIGAVLRDPPLVAALIRGLRSSDPIVRMRAADALEKVTRARPDWLEPFKRRLLRLAAESSQHEVRWHLAQLLPRIPLSATERRGLVRIFRDYLQDGSSIVRTCALQALADLSMTGPALRPAVRATIEAAMADGTPAMRARGRKLLARLRQEPTRRRTRRLRLREGDGRADER